MVTADRVLDLLKRSEGLVPSRVLREEIGVDWREGIRELRARGIRVEETIGASGNHSFRISPEKESNRRITISLSEEDARAILRLGDVPSSAWNAIVNALSS